MLAQNLHIKTTSGIPGAFACIFKKFGVEVSPPGPLTGAVKLDAAAGGAVIPMQAEASAIRWPGLPAGVHTYEVAVSGLPCVRGHLEVLPGILPPPPEGDYISVSVDLLAQWRITVEVGSGRDGLNAPNNYELAQQQGYTGSLDQWLASLKGADADVSGLVPWGTYQQHANAADLHTTAADKTRWNAITPHASNAAIHVTAADKERWDAAAEGGGSSGGASSATVRRSYWRLRWTKFPDGFSSGSMAYEIGQTLSGEGYLYSYETDDLCDIYARGSYLSATVMAKLAQYTAPAANGTYTLERFDMDVDVFSLAIASRIFSHV